MSQIAFKETTVAAAQTLLSTSPLFAIPLVWMLTEQRMTSRVLPGSIVAIAGVFLLFQ
jgi:drug/metabolite transporter (DMT)-like permease